MPRVPLWPFGVCSVSGLMCFLLAKLSVKPSCQISLPGCSIWIKFVHILILAWFGKLTTGQHNADSFCFSWFVCLIFFRKTLEVEFVSFSKCIFFKGQDKTILYKFQNDFRAAGSTFKNLSLAWILALHVFFYFHFRHFNTIQSHLCVRDESSECANSVEGGGKSSSGMHRIRFSAERGLHQCHSLIIIHIDGQTVSAGVRLVQE